MFLRTSRGGDLRILMLLAFLSFLFSLSLSWGIPPTADGYRYISAARYVADTGNLLGRWPETHINPMAFVEPRLGIGLLSISYWAGGEAAGKILLSLFLSICAFPVYGIISLLSGRRSGLIGTFLWIFMPVSFLWLPFFYIDSIALFFGFVGLWALVKVMSEEETDWRWTGLSATSFALSVLAKRTSIIYLYVILLALLYLVLKGRGQIRRLCAVGTILAIFLSVSAVWTVEYLSLGREIEEVSPSLSLLLNASLVEKQVLGTFSELNGFFLGEVASTWLEEHRLLFIVWASCAGLLTTVFLLGAAKGSEGERFWALVGLVAGAAQIAYVQYSTGYTGMNGSLARYFSYVYPPFAAVFARGFSSLLDRRGVLQRLFFFASLLAFAGILVVGVVNVEMRGHHVRQLTQFVEEATQHLTEGPVATYKPHMLYYLLYPREVYDLTDTDLSSFVEKGGRQLLLMDSRLPDEAFGEGFVLTWRESHDITAFLGGTRGRTTIEIYTRRM